MATAAGSSTSISSALPVFIKNRGIPNSDVNRPTCLEICLAAERVAGRDSIVGAQDIKGLWRIYPATKEARNTLLIKGMVIRDVSVELSDTNPYSIRDDGIEKPSTKVYIDGIPISVANSEIEHSLLRLGCELRSDIKHERARDRDNKLTRFLTGKRFVFITVPPTPLEKTMTVSLFTATLYHKEQKSVAKTLICSKCLQSGHHVSMCKNEVVCRTCKKPGHKRGDPLCDLVGDNNKSSAHSSANSDTHDNEQNSSTASTTLAATTLSPSSPSVSSAATATAVAAVNEHRSRTPTRHASLRSLSLGNRGRSGSSKRVRSHDKNSPSGPCDKQLKSLDGWLAKDNATDDGVNQGWG